MLRNVLRVATAGIFGVSTLAVAQYGGMPGMPGMSGTPTYTPHTYSSKGPIIAGVISGTFAGVLAGVLLSVTNAAIEYWRRPQATFVVTLTRPDGIQLSILNVGGRPLREGLFHVAVPESYGPTAPQADLSRSDSIVWTINGVRCVDFDVAVETGAVPN